VAQFEIQFGIQSSQQVVSPPTRKQHIAEKVEEITTKAAANKREKKPLSPEQMAAKDARLDMQVARANSKLGDWQQLDPERVKEAAKQRSYDNVFYAILGKIERNAEKGTYTPDPYQYLATGRVSRLAELQTELTWTVPEVNYPQDEQEAEILGGAASALTQAISRLSRALAPPSKAQDVRSEMEKEADYELEW
jgi:hypothetical protein